MKTLPADVGRCDGQRPDHLAFVLQCGHCLRRVAANGEPMEPPEFENDCPERIEE